jgi:hypothetical protein
MKIQGIVNPENWFVRDFRAVLAVQDENTPKISRIGRSSIVSNPQND